MSNRKFLLVYTGPGYVDYDMDVDPQKLAGASSVTDFVITTANAINYCRPNDAILRWDWVNNSANVPNTCFGTTVASDITKIKAEMKASIDKYTAYNSNKWNWAEFITKSVAIADKITALHSTAKVWFAFPRMLDQCEAAAQRYNYYYEDYIFKPVKTKMTDLKKWDRVAGFYFAPEDIPTWYTKFTPASPNTQFDNPMVKCQKYVSDLVKGDKKELLWIPYYRDSSDLPTRVGSVINLTSHFNFALLQPNYFFGSTTAANLTLIKNCVDAQACKNTAGTIMGGSKTGTTEIGVEMEIDDRISQSAYLGRYNEYVAKYATYITGTTKRPTAFYAGVPASLLSTSVLNRVKSFFTSGT